MKLLFPPSGGVQKFNGQNSLKKLFIYFKIIFNISFETVMINIVNMPDKYLAC